jgi:hypothetical protein
MIASTAAALASLIGYTPYVYNETLGAPYYQNNWNGRIVFDLPAGQEDKYTKVVHFVDQHPAWVYNNIILFVWLLWAARALYKRYKAPIDPIETLFIAPLPPLLLLGAARIAACWALNLYYEGWLIHTQQVLFVASVEAAAYHCSYLVLIPLALLTAMPYVVEGDEGRTAKKNK